MYDRRKRSAFADYRSVLSRSGDVEIGVTARRRRRRAITLSVVGVMLVAGAVWLYEALGPGTSVPTRKVPVKVKCIREECGYIGTMQIEPGTRYPVDCPQCKQRSCWALWRCLDPRCGKEFVPDVQGDVVRCPFCGSENVGAAAPDEP
ncbi:MAG: hypothetical protein PVJ57_01215 [Phycisphaerae bacterium]|jgi:hypothetical protein